MNFNQDQNFMQILADFIDSDNTVIKAVSDKNGRMKEFQYVKRIKPARIEDDFLNLSSRGALLIRKRHTGGITGLSCYGGEAESYGNHEESSDLLLELALKFDDKITLRDFANLKETALELKEDSEGDYYGNSRDYECQIIDLEKFYQILSR